MQIKKSEKLTDERWINLFAADFENNGHTGRWVFASRKTTAAHRPVVRRGDHRAGAAQPRRAAAAGA